MSDKETSQPGREALNEEQPELPTKKRRGPELVKKLLRVTIGTIAETNDDDMAKIIATITSIT